MTDIFICSSLQLLYIVSGYECFFLWKGQALHMYHQGTALLNKKQAGRLVKVLNFYWCGGKRGSLLRKKWLPNFLKVKMGKPPACDYNAFSFWLKRPVAVSPHVQKQAGILPPPALSCMWVHILTPVKRHEVWLTPPPHLKPPRNIWRWCRGRFLGQIDANPCGVSGCTQGAASRLGQHCNTRENLGRPELLLLSQKFIGSNTPLMSAALQG